jgi:hypothetical protein
VGIEEDEHVERLVASIFAVVALELARFDGNRFARLVDELG